MRVRPHRPTDRRARSERRRPHVFGRPAEAEADESAPAAEPATQPEQPVAPDHPAERRHRAAVTPEDVAHYSCVCGFQFEAPVSTSVRCPHCGADQAW